MTSGVGETGLNPSPDEAWERVWWVDATPVPGYFPPDVKIDPATGKGNKMAFGPWDSPITAGAFVKNMLPVDKWLRVAIFSKRKRVKK